MNRLESLLQHSIQTPAAATLGRTLLHSLWEGAAVALALAAILCVARSSRIRYGAACVAMLILLSGLVVTFARLAPEEPIHTPLTATGYIFKTPSIPLSLRSLPPEPRTIDALAWLAPFWIAGVLIFYLRAVTSWMAAHRLRHTGVCCAPDLWLGRLHQLKMRLHLTRPVALLESCLAEVPVVIGYMRPIILMPVGLLAGLPTGQVEAILLHELAHIRRYDYLVNLLQVFVEGLLFYHPAVWWISGVMRAERENCCDDLVVNLTGGAFEYAQALTALEQRRENAGLALAATGGSLVNRIQRLIGRSERRYVRAMPVVTSALLTITVVTGMAALQFKPVAAQPAPQTAPASPEPKAAAQATPDVQTERREFVEEFWLRRDSVSGTEVAQLTKPLTAEQQQAKEEALRKERLTPYKNWIDEDVVYIISDEERKAFREINTDEERAKFVEQFWQRRDPTPGTPENEYKQEIYRRIAYANEHYGTPKLAGWRTDRGRIYIQYGPPDEIESHASGGAYERPMSQGGGQTETFPFVQWRYRSIDGIGQNIILEFVDTTMTGEYRMTMDPNEKDALLNSTPALHLPTPAIGR